MEEEARLPILELVVHLARVGERGAELLDISGFAIGAAAYPGTLGAGQHVGIHVVLLHDILLGGSLAVVPVGRDGAGNLLGTLVGIVDVALVDAHHVGKHVEVVGVVVAAVYVGNVRDVCSAAAPHLRHVGHGAVDGDTADGVPYHHLAPQCLADVAGHDLKESLAVLRVSNGLLVGTDMDIGRIGEYVGKLGEHLLQYGHALIGLHTVAHGTLEGIAVAGHVDLGNDGHAMLLGILSHLAALRLSVVVTGKAGHALGRGELGVVGIRCGVVVYHLEAPSLILGEVPVEGIYLEAREQLDMFLQLIHTDERAAHIVHVATQLEGGPVGNLHRLDGLAAFVVALGQLGEGLCGADDADRLHRLDSDGILGNGELVALVVVPFEGIVIGSFDALHHLYGDGSCRSVLYGAAIVGEYFLERHGIVGVGDGHGAMQRKGSALGLGQRVNLGQQVFHLGLHGRGEAQHQGDECGGEKFSHTCLL